MKDQYRSVWLRRVEILMGPRHCFPIVGSSMVVTHPVVVESAAVAEENIRVRTDDWLEDTVAMQETQD